MTGAVLGVEGQLVLLHAGDQGLHVLLQSAGHVELLNLVEKVLLGHVQVTVGFDVLK